MGDRPRWAQGLDAMPADLQIAITASMLRGLIATHGADASETIAITMHDAITTASNEVYQRYEAWVKDTYRGVNDTFPAFLKDDESDVELNDMAGPYELYWVKVGDW